MKIGSEEHKQLFCRSFVESHRTYEPPDLAWPELDGVSLERLRAIPIWTMALEVELSAGVMLDAYADTEPDPVVRHALKMQAYEEARHGRMLQFMVQKYGLKATPKDTSEPPTRQAFVDFGYNECVDSFAGFGIFKLACDAGILPESLTSLFTRILVEEARHIVFFINWVAWDRERRGLHGTAMQALPALYNYGSAIARRIAGGADMAGRDPDQKPETIDLLFADIMTGLTPAKFVRACVEENDRYMRDFDPRLLRPRFIPTLARIALAVLELFERIRSALRPAAQT